MPIRTEGTLILRAAMSDQDAIEIHKLLMLMGTEVAQAPVDPIIVMEDIYKLINEPNHGAFLMATRGGKLIGVMGLENSRYRYSREYCIREVYFFVHPDHRSQDVGPALLQEATAIADMAGKELYVTIANPNRRRGRAEKIAALLRYQPVGSIYALHPRN
ncbi:GNAT family N-acetyltransferase [Bradyrhizobium sp. BRP22]|uniref:GNAT family N-acetyltransferase n=1 Tax=Bradyrhizobium sp. BRP22 TaxID=2793821 RepID=UPI001CD4972A|nr:GNAT family N-acetyltransferase [Bradyrhizobium sp. BRP22]MCA1458103.1 GNAT family N-acetyltransferase [Bradyrhizobium sp. BRP22]